MCFQNVHSETNAKCQIRANYDRLGHIICNYDVHILIPDPCNNKIVYTYSGWVHKDWNNWKKLGLQSACDFSINRETIYILIFYNTYHGLILVVKCFLGYPILKCDQNKSRNNCVNVLEWTKLWTLTYLAILTSIDHIMASFPIVVINKHTNLHFWIQLLLKYNII